MLKFSQLQKLNIYSTIIIIIKNSLWFFFFFLQGKSIELATNENKLFGQLVYTLVGYVLIKVIVMVCEISQTFALEYFKNIELNKQWNEQFPKRTYKDNEQDQSHLSLLFFDYIPRLFEVESAVYCNVITVTYVFVLTVAALIYSKFYLAIVALLLVFSFNYASNNIFLIQIDKYQRDTNNNKLKILNWISQYLHSYREVSKNWVGVGKTSWIAGIYQPYFFSKHKQNLFYLYRDLLSQILVELPFIINSAIVILGVYYKYITLTQLFIWVGFCQFMINASNAYFENRVKRKERRVLVDQSSDILNRFKNTNHNEPNKGSDINKYVVSEVTLRDGSKSMLSLNPGIYRLSGSNGAGKSTLLNIILGYERRYPILDHDDFDDLINAVQANDIRLIERDAVIFESLNDFAAQIIGPSNNYRTHWKTVMIDSISRLLDTTLAQQWIIIFLSLEMEYTNRVDKNMSSGEKVIISFIRFFVSWDSTVRLLVIDECDSFLDHDKKNIFKEAINNLSRHMAVFISSHDSSIFEVNSNQKRAILDAMAEI